MANYLLPRKHFAKRQKINFFLSVCLSSFFLLALPLSVNFDWFSAKGVATFVLCWSLVGGVGVSVGFHRYFSHRSFHARPSLKIVLAVLGVASGQGPLTYWVSVHRHHHATSDKADDIHSPHKNNQHLKPSLMDFIEAHFLWVVAHDVPSPNRYSRDWMADESIQIIDRHYWTIVLIGLLLPGLIWYWITPTLESFLVGFYWGGVVRLVLGQHLIWSINSVCHVVGTRPHTTADHSRNVALLALPTWGESWHNNHHHQPVNPRLGTEWWQIDLGYLAIVIFVKLGWASYRPLAVK